MSTPYSQQGKTTIAPDVLLNIARLSALGVTGVAHMSPVPGGVNQLFKRGSEGVELDLQGHTLAVDLYLVVEPTANVRAVGRAVQAEVTRAIKEMVGMEVRCVNVHIENVAAPTEA